MISREFIYEFSNFDDISTRENDKKSCAHDISTREMGGKCRQNQRSCKKQPLRLRTRWGYSIILRGYSTTRWG